MNSFSVHAGRHLQDHRPQKRSGQASDGRVRRPGKGRVVPQVEPDHRQHLRLCQVN